MLPQHLGGQDRHGKQLDKQLTNLRSYFQSQGESSILDRAACNDVTPLQLKAQEELRYHKTDEEKLRI